MRFTVATLCISFLLALSCAAGAEAGVVPTDLVGTPVGDFQLLDERGRAHRLYYHQDAPAVVLMSQGNGCPIVRNALPALRDVRDAYADRGVRFYLLNSNLQDDRASIAEEADTFGFDIPVLVDEHQLVGESLGVTRTAEIFVIDMRTRRVAYHGPVDDRLTYQVQRAEAEHSYLADALDDVLAGRAVSTAQVSAPGCIVNFPERERHEEHAQISYADTIAPILESRCVECHQKGSIGPWAMDSYEMVRGFAPMIREVLRTDRMPPWHSDPAIGEFLHDRSLTGEEITTLVHWIEAGAPRGEGDDPLRVARAPLEEWPLGEPDLILEIPPFEVPATGVVDYQRPAIENPLTEGRWIAASTIKVGSREAVHHVLSGHMTEMPEDGRSDETRWGTSVGGYAVGAESQIMRGEVGTWLPAGGAIGFQLHYTPFGRAVTDVTRVGLYFRDEPPELIMRSDVVIDFTIDIDPEAPRHPEVAYLEFPRDAELYGAFPHAHYRGFSSTLTLERPDGSEAVLLSLPKYDFNWQRMYEFAEPVDIPAGSRLIARYEYDNSSNNPANPDPGIRITWGEQSHEEMLYTAIQYRWKEETAAEQRPGFQRELHAMRMFGMLDDDVDGVLQRSELRGRAGRRLGQNFAALDTDGDDALSRDEYIAMVRARMSAR